MLNVELPNGLKGASLIQHWHKDNVECWMLNVELPNGLKGASLIQHSTFNVQHLTFNIQHSTFNIELDVKKENFSK